MSKLAAICAKLKGGAVSVSDNQTSSDAVDNGAASLHLFPPPLQDNMNSDDGEGMRCVSFKCRLVTQV